MAARRWTLQNYNAFLREAKQSQGITHAQAQALYRGMRDGLGRPARAVDLARHPRIRNRVLRKQPKPRKPPKQKGPRGPKPPSLPPREIIASVNYKRRKNPLHVQFSIFWPANLDAPTQEQVGSVIQAFTEMQPLPEGIRVKLTGWGREEMTHEAAGRPGDALVMRKVTQEILAAEAGVDIEAIKNEEIYESDFEEEPEEDE